MRKGVNCLFVESNTLYESCIWLVLLAALLYALASVGTTLAIIATLAGRLSATTAEELCAATAADLEGISSMLQSISALQWRKWKTTASCVGVIHTMYILYAHNNKYKNRIVHYCNYLRGAPLGVDFCLKSASPESSRVRIPPRTHPSNAASWIVCAGLATCSSILASVGYIL